MKKNKIIAIAGAIIVFIIALVNPINPSSGSADEKIEVLVALDNIVGKSEIKESNVILKSVAKSAVPEGAISDMESIKGKIALSAIYPGDVITSAKLKEVGDVALGLNSSVEEGMRAITLVVEPDTGLHGMLRIGDRVDVISVIALDEGQFVSKITLENKKVLGLNKKINNDTQDPDGETYVTATLEVTPEEAVQMSLSDVVASKNRLIMRNQLDEGTSGLKKLNKTDFIAN